MSEKQEESKLQTIDDGIESQSPNNHILHKSPKKGKKDAFSKRRYTVSSDSFKSYQKKRRKNDFIPPTVFLLGGNIHDPLNLKSIKSNDLQKQITPQSSPSTFPPNKDKLDVLIPPNIRDPLNLACSESLHESDLISPSNLNKRCKRRRTSSETELIEKKSEFKGFKEEFKHDSFLSRRNIQNSNRYNPNREKFKSDMIVSPVVPQCSAKFPRNNFTKPFGNNPAKNNKEGKKNSDRKNKESHNEFDDNQDPNQNKYNRNISKNEKFQYGNYNRYYGYRNAMDVDPRINLFQRNLFEGKDVLDIGCNVGHVTLSIARDFAPRKIVGIDIDPNLISAANKNIRHYITEKVVQDESFPISMPILYGPILAFPDQPEYSQSFPNNVVFVHVNYIPDSDDCLQYQKAEYDCILCLSVTKWVHFNWGDEGVKRMFKRIFLSLRPGGCLILEPQPWISYFRKSKLTPKILENFRSICFKPEHFNEFLLKDVGFKSCELLGTPSHNFKGFERPIYLYTKK